MSSSLENIQVGDWVRIEQYPKRKYLQVTHVTAKQFTAGGDKFWKDCGISLKTGLMGRSQAFSVTPEELQQEQDRQKRCELTDRISSYLVGKSGRGLSLEMLSSWMAEIEKAEALITEADND